NRTDNRTWFIQSFRRGENNFHNVQVLQQDDHDKIITNYLAAAATYDASAKGWQLQNVKIVNYDPSGNIVKEDTRPSLTIADWSETPYRLSSANVRAEYLSIPELDDYLRFNSD